MKTLYYFKFVVSSHYAMEHNTYNQAVKSAKKLKEKNIYLTIYNKKNSYKEPYDEITLGLEETEQYINDCKEKLIVTFNKYV